jgi:hypothetical protein
MARSGIFQALRRRGAVLCAVLAYALLLNALLAAVFNVQAIAAALDPLSVAATCDSSGANPGRDPVRHKSQHQPDCTLCSPACPMGGMLQGLGSAVAVVATPPSSFGLDIGGAQWVSSIHVRSVYVSDTAAQAPPAIG